MQESRRPRRTSELHEEPGTLTKRQSRVTTRSTSSIAPSPAQFGTAQKLLTRGTLTGSATVKRNRPTPKKPATTSARVLFTSEKQRDNKKWIQDQAQRITEYLRNAWVPGTMPGITEDFWSRSNCLKQMSIKQFVAIVNHFLHFIWGNRFTVGSNHVEDIINILNKLDYPHPVNRSWLITPNTTHSFGNVIMILDFLMDFVPEKEIAILGEEATITNTNGNRKELHLDVEFKTKLLQNCLESYRLWDKKLDDDLEKKKYEVVDLYVLKRCGVLGLDALNVEIEQLNNIYEDVRKQCPYIDPKDEEKCKNLKSSMRKISKELKTISDEYRVDNKQLQQMMNDKVSLQTETKCLEKENDDLQMAIQQQVINVQQEMKFVQKHEELRLELQSYERTLEDLMQREQKETEEFSNMWQKITGQIEKFNLHLRDLIAVTESKYYHQIPLNATQKDIQKLHEVLNTHRTQLDQKLQAAKKRNTELEIEIDAISHEIASDIELRISAQGQSIERAQKALQHLKLKIEEESKASFKKEQKLNDDLKNLNSNIEKFVITIASKREELDQLTKGNEDKLVKAEEAYEAYSAEREAHIVAYETGIKQFMQELGILKEHIESEMEKTEKITETKQ